MKLSLGLNKGLTRLLALVATGILCVVIFVSVTHSAKKESDIISIVDQDSRIISDLEIRTCSILSLSCSSAKGWWKVPKSLNYNMKGRVWSRFRSQYLFVKTIRIDDLKADDRVVSNLQITDDPNTRWTYNLDKFDIESPERYYYSVDVLFGSDAVDPRPEWEIFKKKLPGINGDIPVYLTLRRRLSHASLPKVDLQTKSSNFKILQVADLHFSSFEGICRDQYPEVDECKADIRTIKFVNTVLDIEKPDLVVLTGDQIFGEDSFDSMTTLFKVLNPFIVRKIPYALMFGNHDDEGSLSRKAIMNIVENLPYSLASAGPEDISGVGNYAFQITEKDSSKAAITIYVLDSHKYSPNPKIMPGYDWLKEDQLEYMQKQHEVLQQNEGSNHVSFGFFHIPLPEYKNLEGGFVGNYKEGITAPRYNTNGRDILQSIGVSVISVGHDHCNDYCLLDSKDDDNKVWLCYGGAVGEGGYGGYGGTTRRLRIFSVDTSKANVESYKRLETSPAETFDHQVLVRNGKAQ